MKLINYTLLFISATLFVTVSLWAVLFYYQLLTQVKTTIDEGLANYKIVLIDNLKGDSVLVQNETFSKDNFLIKQIDEDYALQIRDSYKDTLVYSTLKENDYRTRLLTTAFVANDGNYYEMKIISQELDNAKLIQKIATSLLWLYLFLFISTIIINNVVLNKTWQPFYKIINYLNDFQLDKGSIEKPGKTKIKEFEMLNNSVESLLKTNIDVYNSQKQFIENAAHELQTPLAIGINKLELLAGEKDLSPEHIRNIGEIIDSFQRLSGLNKSLLLLSKIENKQFISSEDVNFNTLIGRVISDFIDYVDYREIEIQFDIKESWVTKMNRDLAEMLVMNLVKNAIFHNSKNGRVDIQVNPKGFTIENTSEKPMLESEKLFKRFYKNSDKQSSTGLGLAIVKAIADVSGLVVLYSFNKRHVFKVSQK